MRPISGQLQCKIAICRREIADPAVASDRLAEVFTAIRRAQLVRPGGRFLRALGCALALFVSANALAEDAGEATRSSFQPRTAEGARESDAREAMCLMIESAAKAADLPLEFFARVIWQESRFRPDAIGPVTRNGQRAQGIAQFMPGTANERGVLDPFNPVHALPKSAEFLAELRDQFGNLGLAAAAYNAGPRRVQEWLAGTGPMPQETRSYVVAITGSTVEDWAKAQKGNAPPARTPTSTCRQLMALLKQAPNPSSPASNSA